MFQLTISANTAEDFAANVAALAATLTGAKPQEATQTQRTRKSKADAAPVEAKAEPEAEVETKPEPVEAAKPEPAAEPAPEEKAEPAVEAKPELTGDDLKKAVDALRGWLISAYLNTIFDKPQERGDAFKAICQKFGLAKFGDLTADQIEPMREHVQGLIDAAVKG